MISPFHYIFDNISYKLQFQYVIVDFLNVYLVESDIILIPHDASFAILQRNILSNSHHGSSKIDYKYYFLRLTIDYKYWPTQLGYLIFETKYA